MFKNLLIYAIGADWSPELSQVQEALARVPFTPCAPTQEMSFGWIPPRGLEHSPLVESIDGHWHAKIAYEQRFVPAWAITDRTEELAEAAEKASGRKPGKKALKELKEQAKHELLPNAFRKTTKFKVWIAPEQRLLMIDVGNAKRAEEIVSQLVKSLDGLALHLVQTAESPAKCMTAWLLDGVPPADFVIDRETQLTAADEMKSTVRYARHALDIEEVRQHLTAGKVPTMLAMTWKDRVSFKMTDTLQIKSISFLDVVFEGRDKPGKDEQFDADAAIATGELSKLIPALIEGLGGEHDFFAAGAALVVGESVATAGAGDSASSASEGETAPWSDDAASPAGGASAGGGQGEDQLYERAVQVVKAQGSASISTLQRHLNIGYNVSARLLEEMERQGLVSPMATDGKRTVLMDKKAA